MLTRRQFAGVAALSALGYSRVLGASEALRVAAVGVGGKGWSDLTSVAASPHVGMPRIYPASAEAKIVAVPAANHYTGWADACRSVGRATSSFGYAGPLTECVLLGAIAVRCQEATLSWDAAGMKLADHEAAAAMLTKEYRKGW